MCASSVIRAVSPAQSEVRGHSGARGFSRLGYPDQIRSDQIRSGQVRSGQVRSGQVRSGQVRSGQVRSGYPGLREV
jgi:hypothetical protein